MQTGTRCEKLLLIICLFSGPISALEISSSVNPVGSGARATAMGGAFLAFADDATAVSWNPAGLTQLRHAEISLVGSYFDRKQEYFSDTAPEISSEQSFDTYDLNFLSFSSPVERMSRLKNMTISASYQKSYELKKNVSYNFNRLLQSGIAQESIEFTQQGVLGVFSLSVAYKPDDYQFSLGISVNDWTSNRFSRGWNSSYSSEITSGSGLDRRTLTFNEINEIEFSGQNYNVGGLLKMYENEDRAITLGAIFKSSFDATLNTTEISNESISSPTGVAVSAFSAARRHTLTMPSSVGLGIAYKHSDSVLIAFDWYKIFWSKHILYTSNGLRLNPIDLSAISEGYLSDTMQYRLGFEKVFVYPNHLFSLRSGVFHDVQPNVGGTDSYLGVGIGIGYSNNNVSFDMSSQISVGDNVSSDLYSIEDSSMDVVQREFLISTMLFF